MGTPAYPTLPNAPIVDAYIAVSTGTPLSLDALKHVSEALLKQYPSRRNFYQMNYNLKVNDTNQEIIQERQHIGFILVSDDGKREVNLLPDSVVLRDGNKYKTGDEFIDVFKTVWDQYSAIEKFKKLRRTAIRYVNKFKLKPNEIGTALLMFPVLHSNNKAPTLLTEATARYSIRSERYAASANVLLDLKASTNEETLEITLDTDAFDNEIDYYDFETIKGVLARLRDFKNQIFFDNIKDAEKRFA